MVSLSVSFSQAVSCLDVLSIIPTVTVGIIEADIITTAVIIAKGLFGGIKHRLPCAT